MREEIRREPEPPIGDDGRPGSARPTGRFVAVQFLIAGAIVFFSQGLEVLLERNMELSSSSNLSVYGVVGAITVFWAIPKASKHVIIAGTVAAAEAVLLMVGGGLLSIFNQSALIRDSDTALVWISEKGLGFTYVVSILWVAIWIFRRLDISR